MSKPSITLRNEEGIAWLTLSRPDRRNAIGPDLAQTLHQLADRCADDPEVRCVVLTGSGRFFCVGGDIDLFAAAGDDAETMVLALAHSFHAGMLRLATMDKPLVVAVNGPAAGAGFSLAIVGDIVIAAQSAHFTAAYSAVGLTPDGGATWWLPRLIGMRQAQEMILTNCRVPADEALSLGLVTRVVPDEDLEAAAREIAASFAAGPVRALGKCKALLLSSADNTLAAHLDAEAAAIATASSGAEGREGVAAFVEKRTAAYPKV
jgi:2-(1,2-epoxy-1,2-dihydrophenyl)acetyl-CoA isomerase